MLSASEPVPINPLLNAALEYGRAGWPVAPLHSPRRDGTCDCNDPGCTSVGKHPRTQHGLKDASRDELTIQGWWSRWPRANIALVVPRGYVVIDIDGPNGLASLNSQGYELPPTAQQKTGRGSHHLYKSIRLIPPKVGLFPHVDLRGPGSYIVAAPSLHASQVRYAWQVPLSPENLADAPEWLAALLEPQAEELRTKFDTAGVLNGVASGGRDVALFKLASKLRYADVPYETALALVCETAAKCTPPFSQRDAEDKVKSAYGRYQPSMIAGPDDYRAEVIDSTTVRVLATTKHGPIELTFSDLEKTSKALDAELSIRLLMPGTPSEEYTQRINLLSMSARQECRRELDNIYTNLGWTTTLQRAFTMARDAYLGAERSEDVRHIAAPERLEFIVDGFIPADGVTVLFGSGSAGKTMLGLSIALAVVRGVDWLGRLCKQRNVTVIDYETGGPTFGYRVDRICSGLGIERSSIDGLRYLWADGIPLPDLLPSLKPSIAKHNTGLFILDHAALACGGEPEKADSALRFYRAASRLGVPMLVLAHVTGNGEIDPALVQRPFGSVFWSNSARRTWFIQREQEQESDIVSLGLFCRKVNDGRKPADWGINLFFDGDAGPVRVTTADMRDTPLLQQTRPSEWKIWDVLTEYRTYVGIAACLQELGVDMTPANIRKTISRHPRMFDRAEEPGLDANGNPQASLWGRANDSAGGADRPDSLLSKKIVRPPLFNSFNSVEDAGANFASPLRGGSSAPRLLRPDNYPPDKAGQSGGQLSGLKNGEDDRAPF